MGIERRGRSFGRPFLPSVLIVFGIGLLIEVDGQTSTVGSISGTLRDSAGAVISKADVVVRDERTGFSRTVSTNDDGFYLVPSLPFGRYSLSTAPSGFKKIIRGGVELHVTENAVVNLILEVGEITEIINVQNEAAHVETRSATVSSLISEKQVAELPLIARNYSQFALMVPGVSPSDSFNARATGIESLLEMSVNGNASNGNLWTIDGVNNTDIGLALIVNPSIDAIQEFRVERNSFSAEFGQAQGAVINLITRGGSNQFHGTIFEFFRNDALNATDFFLNKADQPKGELKYNDYGFNFSGPIKKNRAFFFWSEEWRRERRAYPLSARVPTAAEKLGDFSGLLTDPLPHDPNTCKGNPNDPTLNVCDPFPGNKIPANHLSPVGLALLKVYPDPNNPADPTGLNWISAPVEPIGTHQDLIRGDVNIAGNMNMMIRWIDENWTHESASGNFWGDTPFPTVSSDWGQDGKSFVIKVTNSFGSSYVNELQFSLAGNGISITTNPKGRTLNDEIVAKFPTVFPRSRSSIFPTLWGSDGYESLLHVAPWDNDQDLFNWKDDISKVTGVHHLRVGGFFSHNMKDELTSSDGLYQICGTSSRTGNAIADLLVKDLPLGCYFESDHQERISVRWHDLEFYGSDMWKVRPTLTLTLGVRWSRFAQPYSANDRLTNFIPRLYDGENPESALVQADTGGFNRALVNDYNRGFQPRVGLAWDVFGDGKSALRVGAGRYLGRPRMGPGTTPSLSGNPPWTRTVDEGFGGGSISLSDSPDLRSLDTVNSGLKSAVAVSTSFNAINEDFPPTESWQWNLSISREVMKNTVVEASYIGNHALHLVRNLDWNDVIPSARIVVAQAIRANDPTANDLINANRRLPGVASIFMAESSGNSSYHALQVWANSRFSDRIAFQAAYTWSHGITNVPLVAFNGGATDPFNYDLDRGDADLDRRQMFVANAVVDFPSIAKWSSAMSRVLGDWQVNVIASLLDGIPLDVVSGANTAGLAGSSANLGQRADLVPGVPVYLHNSRDHAQYLNPAAFALPAVGQFGNLGRGAIRGPGIKNVDFCVAKNWRVRDHYRIQFRAEMFNAFNHPNFAGVDTNLSFDNVAGDEHFGKPLNEGFGAITGTRGSREVQFGLKFSF